MNMTLEEVKLYHYRLWNEIVNEIPYNMGEDLDLIKYKVFEKLRYIGLVPKEEPFNYCYLCDYYTRCRNHCPLNGCESFFSLAIAIERHDIDNALALAKSIRDIFEKEG